jgi:hypothetical protein
LELLGEYASLLFVTLTDKKMPLCVAEAKSSSSVEPALLRTYADSCHFRPLLKRATMQQLSRKDAAQGGI